LLPLDSLHLGDCLELLPLVDDASIDLILSDLPYNTTQNAWDTAATPLSSLWAHYRRILRPTGAVILTAAQPFTTDLINSARDWFRYDLIWQKNIITGHLNAHHRPMRSHESILVFSPANKTTYNPQNLKPYNKTKKRGTASACYGAHALSNYQEFTGYPRSILEFRCESGFHPTQKPITLFEYLIRTYSHPGQLVLDSHIGSGTTAIAAINAGRHYIGIEKDPAYFAIAENRIHQQTKSQAA